MDTAAPAQESANSFMKFLKGAGNVTKLAAGAGTVALGVAFLGGLPLAAAVVFGGIALAAGGRQVYQAGKALFGKTDETKPGWKSRLARAADSLGVGWTGAVSFSIGGYALALGSTAALPALLVLGGMALMTVGTAQLATNAITAVCDGVKHVMEKNKAASPLPAPTPAPEPSAAPKVGTLEAAPGFEKAASPEAKVEAPAPAPVNAPAPPRP